MNGRVPRPGEEPRATLAQPVALRFKLFGDFVEEMSCNLSSGGIFICTDDPRPVSSIFDFELRPEDGSPVARGKAQVAWIRRRVDGDGRPAGMGARFVEVDDDSRRTILHLVAGERELVGEASASATRPPAPESPPTPTWGTPAAARAAAAPAAGIDASHPARPAWILLPTALVVALAAALWLGPREGTAPATGRAAPADGDGASVPAETTSPAGTAAAPVTEPAATAVPPQVLAAVEAWARAWSEQRADDYLAAYSASFEPPGGLDLTSWRRQRRARLRRPSWIEVGLAFVEVEPAGAGRSRVRFVQAYDSDGYRDVVRKTLELVLEDGAWRIVRETVEP